jgi:signal transduction histidine kinase
MGEGMVGWVAKHGKRLLANDVSLEPRYYNPFPDEIIRSELSVPIQIGSEIAGVLDVQSRNPDAFDDNDILVLETLADQLAAALQNAQLFAQIKQYAGDLEQRVAARTADLEAANEHLQALGQIKDKFVSNVSHELRTPIANLKIYHEIIAKKPDQVNQHLVTLNRETRRLEHIVEDLLYLSRLEQDHIPMEIAPININQLIGQYVADREKLAEEQGLNLEFVGGSDLSPVLADEMAIGQVVGILVTNALNYTPRGGSIVIRTQARLHDGDRQQVGFRVSDTGLGISKEEQDQLFERFFRGEAAQQSGKSGTGLGLAIAYELVERHRGSIEIESNGTPGEGTTFTVWLPVAQVEK